MPLGHAAAIRAEEELLSFCITQLKDIRHKVETSRDGDRPHLGGPHQGCQIFLDTIYQNGGKYTKLQKLYRMVTKYTKCPKNISNDQKIYQHFQS
jgi:hypothetical protein